MRTKCQCMNCNHIQYLYPFDIVDCEQCGSFINAKEDKQ